jgi:hypothetical protein
VEAINRLQRGNSVGPGGAFGRIREEFIEGSGFDFGFTLSSQWFNEQFEYLQ